MLLVARRVGEALRIGTNIEVKVVAATRSRVMLAVTAPRELTIRRIYGKSDYKNASESGELAEAPDTTEHVEIELGADETEPDDTGQKKSLVSE
jgi:carbon storage regulator CsrA